MRRLILLPALLAAAALIPPAPAAASCVGWGEERLEAHAEVILVGEVLAAGDGPVRLRVTSVEKGEAPAEVEIRDPGGPGVVSSVDIDPRVGETWRILGSRARDGAIRTSICDGSARIGGPAPDGPGQPVEPPPAAAENSLAGGILGWIVALLAFLG